MDATEKREHHAAVTALPGRDGRSGRGAFGRRGDGGGRLAAKAITSAVI